MGMNSLGAMSLLQLTEERVSSLQGRAIGVVQGGPELIKHASVLCLLAKLLGHTHLVDLPQGLQLADDGPAIGQHQ